MRYVLASAAIIIALAAALGFQREYAASLTVRDTEFRVIEKLAEAAPTAPRSWRGIRNVMLACYDTQMSIALQFQPVDRRSAVHANCAGTANSILSSAPTTSAAHLVLAASAAYFEDSGFSMHLAHAQATAPREGWLVARRHALGAGKYTLLDATGRALWAKDTGVLLEERWGQLVVADTFVAQTDMRQIIEALVETLPNEDQRRFVALVREKTLARQAY